jgi:hypothetical protein
MHNTHTPMCPSDIHGCVYAYKAPVLGTGNTIPTPGRESVKDAGDGHDLWATGYIRQRAGVATAWPRLAEGGEAHHTRLLAREAYGSNYLLYIGVGVLGMQAGSPLRAVVASEDDTARAVVGGLEGASKGKGQAKSGERRPCRSVPVRMGVVAEPALRASEVTLAAAVRAGGATSAMV